MTDITERLRRLYVQHGTDYVQAAADEIERLRDALTRRSGLYTRLAEVHEGAMKMWESDERECAMKAYEMAAELKGLREEVERLRAELAACREAAVYLFNCGYRRGHHDTVEACYVDIHDSDMRTYQSDVVVEVIDEALAARKGEGE